MLESEWEDDVEEVAHHFSHDNGHILDEAFSCWCEPRVYREGLVRHVEHNDAPNGPNTHAAVLEHRAKRQDWVTVLLSSIKGTATCP